MRITSKGQVTIPQEIRSRLDPGAARALGRGRAYFVIPTCFSIQATSKARSLSAS